MGCEVLAINGIPDHVHLVVKLKSTIAISLLVKQAKGVSSKFINEQLIKNGNFRWRGGFGAFTISRWDLQMVINYVNKQKSHHQEGSYKNELELKAQEGLKRPCIGTSGLSLSEGEGEDPSLDFSPLSRD